MREHKKLYLVFAAFVVLAVAVPFAWAQQEVQMYGVDPSSNVIRVRTDTNGYLITSTSASTPSGAASGSHGACTNTTMNVGTTGTACPASPRADRVSVLIQLVQTGETLTVTSDGSTTATATVGVQVSHDSVYTDTLAGTVSANCRCSAATCSVRIAECP